MLKKFYSLFRSSYFASAVVALLILYFVTHLVGLTELPVFADESIYIRWSQLIMDDAKQYLFFALNDGKTPLFIWSLIPLQYILTDPLAASRLLSVGVGAVQVVLIMAIVRAVSGSRAAQLLAGLLTSMLPFWYFHHRMALMDGMLTLWISLATLATIKIVAQQHNNRVFAPTAKQLVWVCTLAVSLGAAFWTKLPAVLAIPSIAVLILMKPATPRKLLHTTVLIGSGIGGALVLFALLKISPAFGQLFSRGSDFLFPITDVLLKGVWQQTIPNLPTYWQYYWAYLTPGVLVMIVLGLILPNPHRRSILIFLVAGLAFFAPIALFGKVVYPRYFLPSVIFFTVAAALSVAQRPQTTKKNQRTLRAAQIFSLALVVIGSLQFIVPSMIQSSAIPFVASDRVQYLTEWSSGHGITEVTSEIRSAAQTGTIAVATEGFFGTLPDAILLYLHAGSVENTWVEGIGQPVAGIPESFSTRAERYETIWLVVNSHRMLMELPENKRIQQYCRPFAAPCLEVWDITEYIHTQNAHTNNKSTGTTPPES